jgi:RNA polymerase sigma-70 factor (ECF subfamily)
MTDEQILALFTSRDEAALAATRSRYGARLYRTAMNILKNREDAEEVVADTLLKAWENVHTARPSALGAYLARASRNLALNKWKARTVQKRGGNDVTVLLGELEDTIPGGSSPEREYEAGRLNSAIDACLRGCDNEARTAFLLRYFHGESILGICARMRMSPSKAKSMLLRTRRKLHDYLQKEDLL